MHKLFAIIDRLLIIFVQWSVNREQKKAQRERDELQENPADWFISHFDSVPNTTNTQNQTDKADTANTKTD